MNEEYNDVLTMNIKCTMCREKIRPYSDDDDAYFVHIGVKQIIGPLCSECLDRIEDIIYEEMRGVV